MNPASRSVVIARTLVVAAALLCTGCSDLRAQSGLAGRVAAAPDGDVRFSFAARPGVCGDGTTFFAIDGGMYFGTVTSIETARGSCAPGPVRVVLDRAGGQVIGVRTFVGPAAQAAGAATDLGEVPPREAADYLLGLAATTDGRPGRDAITPAALAQGVDVGDRLIAIARDANRPLDTRRAAMSWLGRGASAPDAARRASAALLDLARSESQPHAVRRQAVTTLARLDGGAGVPGVIALAGSRDDAWVTREAVAALARSGDPRARESLREVVRRGTLPDEPTSVAIRGLAGEYATAQDAALLRGRFVQLQGERSRRAVVTAMTERGGAENARWLLQVAARSDEREAVRRSALSGARRAGASSAEIARLYDQGDNVTRSLVVSALASEPDDVAVAKLLDIARSGDDRTIRRRAVAALGRIDDPKVKAALGEIVVR